MLDRRAFIGVTAGGLLVLPLPARAQRSGKVRRIGILTAGTIGDWPMFAGLRELGWIEGHNLVIERRSAGGKAELVPGFAEELVKLKLDVIVVTGAVASLAAKNATTTVPLVTITGDGREARRTGYPATNAIRVRDQPDNGESAGYHGPAGAATSRGADRVIAQQGSWRRTDQAPRNGVTPSRTIVRSTLR